MHRSWFPSHALPMAHAMKQELAADQVWCQQNLVEVVHLAALHLQSKGDSFTFQELVRATRHFYGKPKPSESLIAAALVGARIEADWNSHTLKLSA